MKLDYEIQQAVIDELHYEPSIDATRIGVASKNGIITLTGTVESYTQKDSAARVVERVSGVKAVVDEMSVELPQAHERGDQDIAQAALQALEWHVQVPHARIRMKVEKGMVTLEGDVDYRFQQIAAKDAVLHLTGVKTVVNLINIKPLASPSEVKTQIENALRRAAEIDAERIKVDVYNGRVILHGTVRSRAERSEVERAAWAAPGVREVEDDLTVAA